MDLFIVSYYGWGVNYPDKIVALLSVLFVSFMEGHVKKANDYLFIFLVGLLPYWLMNSVVWIPWVYLSKTAGMVMMIMFVPIFWGTTATYVKKHVTNGIGSSFTIGLIFLFGSVISDVFFFLVWRKLTINELYHWTSIASYILVFTVAFSTSLIKNKKPLREITFKKFAVIAIIVGILFIVTLYCVRFW